MERRLNLAVIGVGGRGKEVLGGAFVENVVAIADVDEDFLRKAALRCCGETKLYNDYRRLLEENHTRLDGVVVNTPDHTHFPISMLAMEYGLHVYCEKPLAHSVRECRLMAEKAREKKVITQTGMQMHALENYRRVVEMIQSDAIGTVSEVHVWCGKGWGGNDVRPAETQEPPRNLHWDLWLGNAPQRPYHSQCYHPANWRRWWDFGSGTLGDMGCHYMDLAFWALNLDAPKTIRATGPSLETQTEMAPLRLRVDYVFPTPQEEIQLTWYDGDETPEVLVKNQLPLWLGGVLFVGSRGMLLADYTHRILLPEADFANYEPPPATIPPSPGHLKEWLQGIRTQEEPSCHFGYTGRLTEAVLLGVVAYRCGETLYWDAAAGKVIGNERAQKLVEDER
ncbi:MAG: Gfo/Idh/MocA family oxidoreductase [Planctomycetia bacterium]|nr:Gfo/Idh/MocA family oxidoreductase [Planctomycetia bacterium]